MILPPTRFDCTLPYQVGTSPTTAVRQIGRYALHGEIASGGMATVHLGRLLGPVGFSRTVAIKRMHEQCAKDPEFVSMFLDEGRLAARIRHPNVVPVLDVVSIENELFLVMDFVLGEPLSRLLKVSRVNQTRVPVRVAAAIVAGMLEGLHAAHEAAGENGQPLGIVHRDVSPQNVMVGIDGIARVVDFGVAKAVGRLHTTRQGQVKGKLPYMAPEQILGNPVDRRTDIYSASVILWETLTGRRLFDGDNDVALYRRVLEDDVSPPSSLVSHIIPVLDQLTVRGLARDPEQRFQTAREMAIAIENSVGIATPREVGRWVENNAPDSLKHSAEQLAEMESLSSSRVSVPPVLRSPRTTMTSDGQPETVIGSRSVSPAKPGAKNWLMVASGGLAVVLVAIGAAFVVGTSSSATAHAPPSRNVSLGRGWKPTASVAPAQSAPAVSSAIASATPPTLPTAKPRPTHTKPKPTATGESLYSRH